MSGYSNTNDPLNFAPQLQVLFPNTGLKIEGLLSTGKYTALLPQRQYQPLSGEKRIVDLYTLSKDQAKVYADIFQKQSDRATIPWILGPLSLAPAIGSLITLGTSALDGMYRLQGAGTVSAPQLVVLMAEGGVFKKTWSLEKHPQHGELLLTMVFYDVTVGKENRSFGLYSHKVSLRVV